jgi:hypothetical protein
MTSIWDDPTINTTGNYFKFEQPGDTITGQIVAIDARRWDDGTVSPQLHLDVNGDDITVTAGQVRLKAALAEQRPEPGDSITITMTDLERRAGGKTLKHFKVDVVKAGGTSAKAKGKTAAAPVVAEQAYTAEQVEAMKLLGIDIPQ